MKWAASGIPHTKITQLLKILGKHKCFKGWPSDARTLLNTPRKTQTHQVAGGEYHHWGVENKVVQHMEAYKELRKVDTLKLLCSFDGLPLTKSTNSQVWPILLAFEDFPSIRPFAIGMYHGYMKPSSAEECLRLFVEEMTLLKESGVTYGGKNFLIQVSAYILDTPAYSLATGTVSHTGYYSCRKCVTRGEYEDTNIAFNDFNAILGLTQVFVTKHKRSTARRDLHWLIFRAQ
ncbi:uncharacterized protein LOC124174239 [Ischnura elegans]|uniref:uncharacterized protein LOC124174239 n=1 Tax=Ischnura elegans TaxID=197161 RepID=UPI001ED86BD3|nr:uncharacterized protein LOC124174239 [Ischnura elegans]